VTQYVESGGDSGAIALHNGGVFFTTARRGACSSSALMPLSVREGNLTTCSVTQITIRPLSEYVLNRDLCGSTE